jgi:hypothetical protein
VFCRYLLILDTITTAHIAAPPGKTHTSSLLTSSPNTSDSSNADILCVGSLLHEDEICACCVHACQSTSCMCIPCIAYSCVHACIHVCCTYACMSVCTYIYLSMCVYVSVCLCTFVCLCMHVSVYKRMHVCMYACMYVLSSMVGQCKNWDDFVGQNLMCGKD